MKIRTFVQLPTHYDNDEKTKIMNAERMNSKINSICVVFCNLVCKENEHSKCIFLQNAKTHLSRGFGIYFSNKFISFYVSVSPSFNLFLFCSEVMQFHVHYLVKLCVCSI